VKTGGRQDAMAYHDASERARDQDPDIRRLLAVSKDTAPEILYYLAEDAHQDVRRAVANNPASPQQADVILAIDPDEEVRVDLARKIGRLAPDLSRRERTHLEKLTLEALSLLAADVMPRVRQIIAEELKTLDNVPGEIVLTLARDVELPVSAPVLEYSPLIDDEALLEIINSPPVQGALSAVSRRQGLAGRLCDAIAQSSDTDAVTELLSNPSAQIREETLDELIDQAPDREPWHRPLALRPDLSKSAVSHIAQFVSTSLIANLKEASLLSPMLADAVSTRVKGKFDDEEEDDEPSRSTAVTEEVERDIAGEVAALHRDDCLDDEKICEHIDRNDRDFATHALSCLAEIEIDVIKKVLRGDSATSVVAACWQAGLSMRTAIEYQVKIARISTRDVIYAKNGIDYPQSPAELKRQLSALVK
jgi:hypothetical protein